MSAAKQRDRASYLRMGLISRFVNRARNKLPCKEGAKAVWLLEGCVDSRYEYRLAFTRRRAQCTKVLHTIAGCVSYRSYLRVQLCRKRSD